MKADIKNTESVSGINFYNITINKLCVKKGVRKDYRFKDIEVSYLKRLLLRYSLYKKNEK
tara:strand:+ start:115 stop:294 length:180 start_codon:yes stop_codon:yes gene_type:complete